MLMPATMMISDVAHPSAKGRDGTALPDQPCPSLASTAIALPPEVGLAHKHVLNVGVFE